MKNLGNFYAGQTVRGAFNSRSTNGAPITLAGTPALAVYKDGSTSQTTTGITLTVDFDAITGHHLYEIVTTDAFYTKGSDFRIVLTAGTVDSVSVVGVEVGSFSIENRSDDLILKNAFVSTRLAIASVTSQTVFVLTGGPTNNIANVMVIIYDASDAGARIVAEGSYVGSSGTLTLTAATAITVTTSDTITLVALSSIATEVATTEIADAVLSRNVSNVEASATEHTLCTIILAMLENSISGNTLTIKRTNGSTTHATKTLTTNAAADPITGIT